MCFTYCISHTEMNFQFRVKHIRNQMPHSRVFFSKKPSTQNIILFLWPFHHPYDMLQEIITDQDYMFLCIYICFLKSVTNQHSKPWTASYSKGQWQHRADKILIQFTPKNHIKLPNLLPNLADTMWSVTCTENNQGQKGTMTWLKVSVEDWDELRKQKTHKPLQKILSPSPTPSPTQIIWPYVFMHLVIQLLFYCAV